MTSFSTALVCGLGRSGVAAARLLRAEGVAVVAVDENAAPGGQHPAGALKELGCRVEWGVSRPPDGDFDVAVVSPGLRVDGPFLSAVRERGIPLLSEMELGWSRFRGRTVAVTGSNGKSTVVQTLADCLQAAGRGAIPCGNFGLPVSQAVVEHPAADWLVIEVSSFQLETCDAFRPDIGVLLNVLTNHLDRHGTMEVYARLKARMFANQRDSDVALTPLEWRERFREWSGGGGQWLTFGATPTADFGYSPGQLHRRGDVSVGIAGALFDNEVLGANAAAVLGAATSAGVSPAVVGEVLPGIRPLPHRAEPVGEVDGVLYVNDSKATNVASLMASVRMQQRPVWLIAGGRPKETDFTAAVSVLRERVRGVFAIGEAAEAMVAAWGGAVPCENCGTLAAAVAAARRAARAGDVVLLAPAGTSYDQFKDFAERGDTFRRLVAAEKTK
jgi:UDP-N-acetylmuramoylalanine--D-glutamate ligase